MPGHAVRQFVLAHHEDLADLFVFEQAPLFLVVETREVCIGDEPRRRRPDHDAGAQAAPSDGTLMRTAM